MTTGNINLHVKGPDEGSGYFHNILDIVGKRVIRVYDAGCAASAFDAAAFHMGIPQDGTKYGVLRSIAGTEKKYAKLMSQPFTQVDVIQDEVKAEGNRQHAASMAKLEEWAQRVK